MATNALKGTVCTVDDAATNTVITVGEFYHTSTGTPAAGIGAKILLGGEDSAGNAQAGLELHGYLSTVTSGAEQGAGTIRLINAGSFQDVLTLAAGSNSATIGSGQVTVNLWNTVATTLNFAQAVTAGTSGATTGNWTFRNAVNRFGPGSGVVQVQANGPVNNFAVYESLSAGSLRWQWGKDSTNESGSDAGSLFILRAFTDAAGLIDVPLSFVRASGGLMTIGGSTSRQVTFTGDISVNGGDLLTSQTTFNLLNATATTINIGAGATSGVNIGNTAGPLTSAGIVIGPATTTSRASFRAPHGTAPSAPTDGDIWTTTAGLYVRINGATVGPLS
jgi:hypothetical protein